METQNGLFDQTNLLLYGIAEKLGSVSQTQSRATNQQSIDYYELILKGLHASMHQTTLSFK